MDENPYGEGMAKVETGSGPVRRIGRRNTRIYTSLSQLRQSSGSRSCWSGKMHLPVHHL